MVRGHAHPNRGQTSDTVWPVATRPPDCELVRKATTPKTRTPVRRLVCNPGLRARPLEGEFERPRHARPNTRRGQLHPVRLDLVDALTAVASRPARGER